MIAKKPRPQLTVASVSELHRQWLELVDTDGPFLAIPPLKRVWPQGMPSLSDERKDTLNYARKDFESAWENFDRAGGGESADGCIVDAWNLQFGIFRTCVSCSADGN